MKNHDVINVLVNAAALYQKEFKDAVRKVRLCRLHEDFLNGGVYGSWKMDLAASDYRLSHTQLDLLNEQRHAGLSIFWLNKLAKDDPAIGTTFLSRSYQIRNIPTREASNEEIATFYKDVRDLLSDFETLVDQATAWQESAVNQ